MSTKKKAKISPMKFYDLLEAIRQKPAMYLGQASFRRLEMWLHGYRDARLELGLQTKQEKEFRDFDEFIQQKYDWHDVGGWAAKILYYHRDDANALSEFFKLLDEFKEAKREQRRKKKTK